MRAVKKSTSLAESLRIVDFVLSVGGLDAVKKAVRKAARSAARSRRAKSTKP